LTRRRPVTPFKAGVLALVVLAVVSYFGFTKANPFSNPFELKAAFRDARNLGPRSVVRVAGVDVGNVTKVESLDESGAAEVTMELSEDALPIHGDARLEVRPRILLEGNYFVDLRPGSPSAPDVKDGDTIPVSQTGASVTLPEILDTLQSDVRTDLRTLLYELGTKALVQGGGAKAFNRTIPELAPAYRFSAITNEALMGTDPDRDIPRVLRGQQRTAAALAANPVALRELVTDLNVTAGALAREDSALAASVPALRDTLRAGMPALDALNAALPTLRAFSREALPGVRSSLATLNAAIPWITQARGLVQEDELKGLAADLRQAVPDLVRLNTRLVPFLDQLRALSSCTNTVLVPFAESEIPSIERGNSGQEVRDQINRSFVGLAGESRNVDANTPLFHVQGVPPSNLALGRIQPAAPLDPGTPPTHRPDVACETQEPPNLSAPGGPATAYGVATGGAAAAREARR
jgi:phospholipid/cholesterol/gamma-HCH transport system substrate-binding protein